MSTNVLLINFSKSDTEKCQQKLGDKINFERGFLSDFLTSGQGGGNAALFYFPHPAYDYEAIFINMHSIKDLVEEFRDQLQIFEKKHVDDFGKFYRQDGGFLVFFLGDHRRGDLNIFDLPQITFQPGDSDREIFPIYSVENTLKDVFDELANYIVKPPSKYIKCVYLDQNRRLAFPDHTTGYKFESIYINNGQDIVGGLQMKGTYSQGLVRCLFLPQFTNVSLAVSRILEGLAGLKPDLFPELYQPDWQTSDDYYHKNYDDILARTKQAENDYKVRLTQIDKDAKSEREKFKVIRDILLQRDDDLKDSVLHVLKEVCGLAVVDMDEENKKKGVTTKREDLRVTYNGVEIAVEVKGTENKSPTPRFFGQLQNHMIVGSYKQGALIVNHDLKTEPDKRPLAYGGEAGDAFNSEDTALSFIDVRVLYNVCKDVFEKKMPQTQAQEILFGGLGRIQYPIKKKKDANAYHKDIDAE